MDGSSVSKLGSTPNSASHYPLKVPKYGVVNVACFIGSSDKGAKAGDTFPKDSGLIVNWPKARIPRIKDIPLVCKT